MAFGVAALAGAGSLVVAVVLVGAGVAAAGGASLATGGAPPAGEAGAGGCPPHAPTTRSVIREPSRGMFTLACYGSPGSRGKDPRGAGRLAGDSLGQAPLTRPRAPARPT